MTNEPDETSKQEQFVGQHRLQYTTSENLEADFVSRGLVALAPESLGIPTEIHEHIYSLAKQARLEKKRITADLIPEVLDIIDAPGVVDACQRLVGKNWAIVPFTHNAPYASGAYDQWWHKDDNGPYNMRKARQHHAIQIELLYYPQAVREDMGPTVMLPYSQYWTFNHEENHDNFAGADHLDFDYIIDGMDKIAVSGQQSIYDPEDIRLQQTVHDKRMRDAVRQTGWPLVTQFEVGPLRAGSVILVSHNLFHRGNHRRDDWHTWQTNPRYMWRFWLYRTTEPDAEDAREIKWRDSTVDPMTGIELGAAVVESESIWRHQYHWLQTSRPPPKVEGSAEKLSSHLYTRGDTSEPTRITAAYRLASIADEQNAITVLAEGLESERESVRRAATYGLVALGEAATPTFLAAITSPLRWVRKAGAFGLGATGTATPEVVQALRERLQLDKSVYVRSVAADAMGCLARRAAARQHMEELLMTCCNALIDSLEQEDNRLAMNLTQGRSIKFVRPTDDCDVCEGIGVDYGEERFKPVRSIVRENALWSMVIIATHAALDERAVRMLESIVQSDTNVFAVGLAMDALNRAGRLSAATLQWSPIVDWESLSRGRASFWLAEGSHQS